MKHFLLVAGAILGLGLVAVAEASFAADKKDTPVRLSADMDLNPAQQAQLSNEALNGSKESARKLANFHFIVRGDRDASIKWFTIGAENGDASCAYQLYMLLNPGPDSEDRKRSLFWLRKAADGGLEAAKGDLKELEGHV